jgi:hypothetical protein
MARYVSNVMPNPCSAEFSPFTTVRSMLQRDLRLGSISDRTATPDVPTTSPINSIRIFKSPERAYQACVTILEKLKVASALAL